MTVKGNESLCHQQSASSSPTPFERLEYTKIQEVCSSVSQGPLVHQPSEGATIRLNNANGTNQANLLPA